MATDVSLVRGSYIPEVVLGGLTGLLGPVILRHAAVRNLLEKLLDSLYSASSLAAPAVSFHLENHQTPLPMCFLLPPILAMCATEPIAPSKTLRPVLLVSRVETEAGPLPVGSPGLPMSAIETIQGLPAITVTRTITSTPVADSVWSNLSPSAIHSYLSSPAMLLQLAGLCSIFIFVTKRRPLRRRSERVPLINKTENLAIAARHSTAPKLQRKPSDAPNWRIPRNENVDSEVIPPLPLQSETVFSAPNPRLPRQRSSTTPPTRSSTVASTDITAPTTKLALPFEASAALPARLAYIPPHKRPNFDFAARRPFADVGNSGNDRDWQGQTAFRANHKRRLSSQTPLQTPLSSEHDSDRLHRRASFTKDMRRHVRANTNEDRWENDGRIGL
ncbi:hypothetical protein C8R45DRAFT_3254 [Mycena sanguinolenta]|nr:hypothetical protein C8R45DRAFT_3254 [Mycena sanguinolenta]